MTCGFDQESSACSALSAIQHEQAETISAIDRKGIESVLGKDADGNNNIGPQTDRLYEPLSQKGHTIRLLRLLPPRDGSQDDEIECILQSGSLETTYHAISYVWGSTENPEKILVNGHLFYVTANLHTFLTVARRDEKSIGHQIWIDAICINQRDLVERSEQVKFMGDIYANAESVIIWLGPSTSHTQALAQSLETHRPKFEFKSDGSLVAEDENIGPEFDRLIRHEWFKRLWVVQEAMKARARIIWCGNVQIEFDSVIDSATALMFWSLDRRLVVSRSDSFLNFVRHASKFIVLPDILQRKLKIFGILELLNELQHCECGDQRDRIYGAISFLPPEINLSVDYNRDTVEVWTTAIWELMTWSKSLEPLRICSQYTRTLNLPSWVPDLDGKTQTINKYSTDKGDDCLKALTGSMWSQNTFRCGPELHLQAFEFDTIQCYEVFQPTLSDKEVQTGVSHGNTEERLRSSLKSWRELAIANTAGASWGEIQSKHVQSSQPDNTAWEVAWWHSIIPGRLPNAGFQSSEVEPKTGDYGNDRYIDAALAMDLSRWLSEPIGKPRLRMNHRLQRILYAGLRVRTMFVTRGGRVGSIKGGCKHGDIVAFLAGLSRPILLRREEGDDSNRRSVVCTCYCDGITRGEEILKRIADGGSTDELFQPIILV